MLTQSVIAFFLSVAFAMLLSPFVLTFAKKLKASQPILSYMDNHAQKFGTPTMGGLIFIVSAVAVSLTLLDFGTFGSLAALFTVGFAAIGFCDDFLKIKRKTNLGLKAWQKIVLQTALAVCLSVICYKSGLGNDMNIPFVSAKITCGIIYIPICVFIILGTTNSVNLTDGLDGLAAMTSAIVFFAFSVICVLQTRNSQLLSGEFLSLSAFCAAVGGALLVFLVANCFPAKIFMGDTGSLGLGGGLSAVALLSGNALYLPICGLVFVVSALSVIVQVFFFKVFKRRVFLMSPLHHHFERKGIHENKIVFSYSFVTLLSCVLLVIFRK